MSNVIDIKRFHLDAAYRDRLEAMAIFVREMQPSADRGCLVTACTLAYMKDAGDPRFSAAYAEAAQITELDLFGEDDREVVTHFCLTSRFVDYDGVLLEIERKHFAKSDMKSSKSAQLLFLSKVKEANQIDTPIANFTRKLMGGVIDVLLKEVFKIAVVGFKDGMTVWVDEGHGNYVKFHFRGFYQTQWGQDGID